MSHAYNYGKLQNKKKGIISINKNNNKNNKHKNIGVISRKKYNNKNNKDIYIYIYIYAYIYIYIYIHREREREAGKVATSYYNFKFQLSNHQVR